MADHGASTHRVIRPGDPVYNPDFTSPDRGQPPWRSCEYGRTRGRREQGSVPRTRTRVAPSRGIRAHAPSCRSSASTSCSIALRSAAWRRSFVAARSARRASRSWWRSSACCRTTRATAASSPCWSPRRASMRRCATGTSSRSTTSASRPTVNTSSSWNTSTGPIWRRCWRGWVNARPPPACPMPWRCSWPSSSARACTSPIR